MRHFLSRLFPSWLQRTSRPEGAIDGFLPPEINISRELSRLKIEQGKALAENDLKRAERIHARRVKLYQSLQEING